MGDHSIRPQERCKGGTVLDQDEDVLRKAYAYKRKLDTWKETIIEGKEIVEPTEVHAAIEDLLQSCQNLDVQP